MGKAEKKALRAAHEAKSKKHAQRTPLPPRAETVAAIAEMVAEVKAEASAPTGNKSRAKADAFRAEVAKHGWTFTEVEAGDHVELTCRRGKAEVIFIDWTNGVYQNNATYAFGDRTVKLRNASAAKQYAARTPEVGAAETERVAANRAFKKRDPEAGTIKPAKLPFDLAEATDGEILRWALGRTIKWHNRLSNGTEQATILANPKQVKLIEHNGERVISFLCPQTGFRACRLSAITQFGRGQSGYAPREVVEARRAVRGAGVKK